MVRANDESTAARRWVISCDTPAVGVSFRVEVRVRRASDEKDVDRAGALRANDLRPADVRAGP